MPDFVLDPRLAGDTLPVTDLALSTLRLSTDARFPWLILVPRRPEVADIIDLDKERARLRKEIEKLRAELAKIQAKMADQKFVANAPAEIIEEQRTRQATFETTLNKFSQALKQLEAA